MFYVKEKLGTGLLVQIDLTDENIFTTCPMCGEEVGLDAGLLATVLTDGDFHSTAVYCEECSKKEEWK